MSDIERVQSEVEGVRSRKYSRLPAQLVAEIIRIEADCIENRAEAAKRVSRCIDDYIETEGSGRAQTN